MIPFITTEPAAIYSASATVQKALKGARNGEYPSCQAITAMPAALDLVTVVQAALIDWRVQLEGKRRDYADWLLDHADSDRNWRKSDIAELERKIAEAVFALAMAGCVDVAPAPVVTGFVAPCREVAHG